MIFAAGMGTRLKPLTDRMPKALVPVGGHPLLDIVISRLLATGIYDRFVINVHHFAQQIIDYVGTTNYASLVRFSDETDELLETGGGLKKASPLFTTDDPILLHNVDILDNVDYEWFSRQHLPEEDAVLLVSKRKTKRYLIFNSGMRLMGWVNIETGEIRSPFPWLREAELPLDAFEPGVPITPSLRGGQEGHSLFLFAFSGIHSFSPRLFPMMERFPDCFGIIDFYLQICHRAHIMGCVKNDLRLLDVGKLDSLAEAEKFME